MKREAARNYLAAHPEEFLRVVYPEYTFAPFHRAWLRMQLANRETLVCAPRGHGKSTVCTAGYALFRAVHDRDVRVLILSNTNNQAAALLSEIKQILTGNADLRRLYGDLRGERWNENEITLRGRRRPAKEATITALGLFGPLTLRHFDAIVADDLLDFENTRTAAQRRKVRQWIGMTLEPTLEPDGSIHWVGTRYHSDDFYGELLRPEIYGRVVVNRDSMGAVRGDGTPLWPERFPREWLEAERRKKGSAIFNCQYQNDVSLMRGRIFRPAWFRTYSRPPAGLRVFQGTDLAISQSEDADYFAHVTVGVSDDGDIYVLEAFRDRLTFRRQVETIAAKWREHDAVRVGVEDVAFQAAVSQELRRTTAVPVAGVRRTVDKVTRAYGLSALVEDGRIRFGPGQEALTSELAEFPEGEHDDLFDALETAVSLARTRQVPGYW